MSETKTCVYCGNPFTPPKPTTPMCEHCWYGGRHHEAQREQLFDLLRAVEGVDRAEVQHTGGGCFGLAVALKDGRFLFATDAVKDESTGQWFAEASLPDPGEPWGLGIYDTEEHFMGERDTEPDWRVPLTEAQLLDAVREIVANPTPFKLATGDVGDVFVGPTHVEGEVYAVITMEAGQVTDCEFLAGMPQWDWLALGQIVRVGNVNGGDSVVIEMPTENKGR